MFLSGPGGLRTVLPLQFPLHSVARFEPRPTLGPLIAALDEHRRFGVVLFDKAEARLLVVFLGGVEEEVRINADVVVGKTDVGGWGGYLQGRYERHREHHLAEHARRTVEHLWAIDKSRPMHALILAGPDEALSALRRALPRALSRLVVDTLPLEMFAGNDEIVQKVAGIEMAACESEDAAIVERVVNSASTGGDATLGWDETLHALSEGRVHMLVLPAGAAQPGAVCPEGHHVAMAAAGSCPVCSAHLVACDDVVEPAIRIAMATDAIVRFLRPEASRLLAARGAAALLRY
jgi:peptide subunit release factor 1 (eRF1)